MNAVLLSGDQFRKACLLAGEILESQGQEVNSGTVKTVKRGREQEK